MLEPHNMSGTVISQSYTESDTVNDRCMIFL